MYISNSSLINGDCEFIPCTSRNSVRYGPRSARNNIKTAGNVVILQRKSCKVANVMHFDRHPDGYHYGPHVGLIKYNPYKVMVLALPQGLSCGRVTDRTPYQVES